jgi:hypothetical protein
MATPIAYGADWSARQIHGDALSRFRYTDSGFQQWRLSFVLRYADFPGQQHAVLTKAEYESHLAAGIRSLLIYQRGTHDPMGGAARGREFGHAAVAYARSIGYRTGEPIYACGDAPIGSYNLDVAEQFFAAFAEVVRAAGYLAGGYGFKDVIYRLQDRNVVDELWLCGAESGWRPGIAIYQWNNGRIYPGEPPVEADLVKQFEPIGGDTMSAADAHNGISSYFHELASDSEHPDVVRARQDFAEVLGNSPIWVPEVNPDGTPVMEDDPDNPGEQRQVGWWDTLANVVGTGARFAFHASVLTEVVKALAMSNGLDPEALMQLVDQKVDRAIADVRLTRVPAPAGTPADGSNQKQE